MLGTADRFWRFARSGEVSGPDWLCSLVRRALPCAAAQDPAGSLSHDQRDRDVVVHWLPTAGPFCLLALRRHALWCFAGAGVAGGQHLLAIPASDGTGAVAIAAAVGGGVAAARVAVVPLCAPGRADQHRYHRQHGL